MKFLKQLSLYTLVGIISAGINFFIMPLLSHYLTPSDYGLLSLFNTYVTILIPIVSVYAYSLLNVEYFKQKEKGIYASLFTSIQIIPFVNVVILGIVTAIFYKHFASLLELKNLSVYWGYTILIITFFAIFYEQFIEYLVIRKRAKTFALVSFLKVGIEVLLTFYFIVYKRYNWEGRIYSWLITSVVFFIVNVIYVYKEGLLKGKINFAYIKEGLVFGAPLVLHGVGKFVINQSDRLFIAKMVSLQEAGIYNIGYTIGSLVMIAVNAFFNFYSPYLMERLSDITEARKLEIVKMSYLYIFGSILLLILISLFAPLFFRYLIDRRYESGTRYVFWVALGYCFWGGYMLFSGFIFFFKKNRILAWLAVFNVISNLLFNYFFILRFGAIGAAYATALSFFLLLILIAYQANKLVQLPWFNFKLIFAGVRKNV